MDEYGLPRSALESLRDVFEKHNSIQKVILYGSRAKGNFRTGSDIDLCIEGDLSLNELMAIENQIDELLLPWKIDLCLKHQIDNPALLDHIKRVGKVFYCKK